MNLFETTAEVPRATRLIDQVIGQERAVAVLRLAAKQRRFVLLIGDPGTGKSLLGRAIAELLPNAPAHCLASLENSQDPTCPRILCLPRSAIEAMTPTAVDSSHNYLLGFAAAGIILCCSWLLARDQAYGVALLGGLALIWLWKQRKSSRQITRSRRPKILWERIGEQAPFIDATASSEGALFGDVRHDPFQSGGVESPPHQLVEPGAVHRAHGGVLYIDEIGSLSPESQKLLLTAIQDKELPITGRQSGSSGTLIRSEALPCDFVLVAAGNAEDLEKISPALRSRILGYGFEVLTESSMPDSPESEAELWRFIAQEIHKDGRIPHFDRSAVTAVLDEARRRSQEKGRLTTRLRELGGLIRIAGDLANQSGLERVTQKQVRDAISYAASIEDQQAARHKEKTDSLARDPDSFPPPANSKISHQNPGYNNAGRSGFPSPDTNSSSAPPAL